MTTYNSGEFKVEEDIQNINPNADDIMDSTETKDYANSDSDDLSDHKAVMNRVDGDVAEDLGDEDDEGGLFGSGSEDEADIQYV